MATFSTHLYRSHDLDSDRVLKFLLYMNSYPGVVPGMGVGEFCWTGYRDLDSPLAKTLGICESADGDIAALFWIEPPNETGVGINPRFAGTSIEQGLYARLIPWARERLAALSPDNSDPIGLAILSTDAAGAEIMTDLGLVSEGDIRHHTFLRDLAEPIPAATLPEGYSVVAMTDSANLHDRVQVHLDVWPEATLDLDRYRSIRRSPLYRPDLDLCVLAPDSRFACFLIAWLDPETGSVQFEPVGARPDFRRLGLSRALIQEALHRTQRLGAIRAQINCYAGNEAGNALYRAAGFELAGRWQWWC